VGQFPLPHDIQGVTDMQPDFIHDALVLSTRMARTEVGASNVRSGEFARYVVIRKHELGTNWFQILVLFADCLDDWGAAQGK
jgi:hypothetical protein